MSVSGKAIPLWLRLGRISSQLFMPPICASRKCGAFRAFGLPLCLNCMRKLEFPNKNLCWYCGEAHNNPHVMHPEIILEDCLYLFHMTPLLSELIHGLKYRGFYSHANFLMLFFQRQLELKNKLSSYDFSIPIPIHFTRRHDRGYNQAEYIAEPLEKMGLPMENKILKRIQNTGTQTKLNKEARLKNLELAFKVIRPEKIIGKRILLVDDVITTGATLNACAKILLDNGAKEVSAFALARVFKKDSQDDFKEEWESFGAMLT